ncbi:hypothetical protein ACRAWD_29830 [Caulobacter segnis]
MFFTGKVPSHGRRSTTWSRRLGPNGNNLNSAYYQSFNLENRYINFAVNLGRNGEAQARVRWRSTVVAVARRGHARGLCDDLRRGPRPTPMIHVLIDGRVGLFRHLRRRTVANGHRNQGGDGGLAAGRSRRRPDLGVMARSNAARRTDLADGSVSFAINILDPAHGYYKTDFVFGGGQSAPLGSGATNTTSAYLGLKAAAAHGRRPLEARGFSPELGEQTVMVDWRIGSRRIAQRAPRRFADAEHLLEPDLEYTAGRAPREWPGHLLFVDRAPYSC